MKLFLFFAFLAVLATTVIAWEKEDHEIFDLVSEVEASEGKGTTFYSWLDVPPTATTSEISKAYRKMSMQLHPDKNRNIKGIHERFARLGVVATILRNKEGRKRYDFFYKNGVPKWRGTGYYYSRFRPGLGSVLVFLTILTSLLQLLVQRLNYKRDLERIERFVGEARSAAWGPKLVPVEGQRKVKVNIAGPDSSNARWIDMVVEGQNVYILDPSGDMHPLDASSAVYPTFSNTWFLALIKSGVQKVIGGSKSQATIANTAEDDDDDEGSSIAGSEKSQENGNGNGSVKAGRAPTVKAGGKRRKGTKKR
ncbi:putative J domain-containing protein C2E1P5.03 [Hypsizygus marmoreus]|uniref:J domain-containing protein C2E1P5.03 n=1 Tax=Hypsizygus marmoreus TaxID=39966 RepID=A0A369JNM2_HYPMA|nr:putative J domain-containing protein C2E1P5.03 [Hypsizygus marmoreus]